MKILITGASGFIGGHLISHINQWGQSNLIVNVDGSREPKKKSSYPDPFDIDIRCAVRHTSNNLLTTDTVIISDVGPDTDWSEALDGIDIVIHLAACAHQIDSRDSKNHQRFNQVNAEGTRNLAYQAAKHHVKRFIYMSTVKVYGENIAEHMILDEESPVGNGCDAYGLSKLAGEQYLMNIANNSAMDFVIIRSPLVYGAGVSANFRSLIKLLASGIPLPFAAIDNERSMLAVDNLVDFIRCCLLNVTAKNQLFLVSDDTALSLPCLCILIRKSLNLSPRLFAVPVVLLKLLARLLGKSKEIDKLTTSIQISTEKAKSQLNWSPPAKVEDAITTTIMEYLKSK